MDHFILQIKTIQQQTYNIRHSTIKNKPAIVLFSINYFQFTIYLLLFPDLKAGAMDSHLYPELQRLSEAEASQKELFSINYFRLTIFG